MATGVRCLAARLASRPALRPLLFGLLLNEIPPYSWYPNPELILLDFQSVRKISRPSVIESERYLAGLHSRKRHRSGPERHEQLAGIPRITTMVEPDSGEVFQKVT